MVLALGIPVITGRMHRRNRVVVLTQKTPIVGLWDLPLLQMMSGPNSTPPRFSAAHSITSIALASVNRKFKRPDCPSGTGLSNVGMRVEVHRRSVQCCAAAWEQSRVANCQGQLGHWSLQPRGFRPNRDRAEIPGAANKHQRERRTKNENLEIDSNCRDSLPVGGYIECRSG